MPGRLSGISPIRAAAACTDPRDHLRNALARHDTEALQTIAEVKRFRERLIGDPAFRTALRDGSHPDCKSFERYRPLWDKALGRHVYDNDGLLSWPDVRLWKSWQEDLVRYRDLMSHYPTSHGTNPRFTAWRQRQMARAESELGPMHAAITHPVAAYELASGCSVGCWFCGISAASFNGTADYDRDGMLWRDILSVMADRLGPAARTGFCYWGTDPVDTPDYDRFLNDHGAITGWIPQTTTAAPLKDCDLIRRVLSLSNPDQPVLNRFSVLTTRQLHTIFEVFTPIDLLLVEIVPQMKDSLMPKARAGRALDREKARPEQDLGLSGIATTIACVSGFLVNLPERRLRLIAPCRADGANPQGFLTFADETFSDGADFANCMDRIVAAHMPDELAADALVSFRRDLTITTSNRGLRLENAVSVHEVRGFAFLEQFAALLVQSPRPVASIAETLVGGGANFFDVHSLLTDLYDNCLIEASPASEREDATLTLVEN